LAFFQTIAVLAAARYCDHEFALISKDLESFVEDRVQIGQFHHLQ
jgi:hypothetical protein